MNALAYNLGGDDVAGEPAAGLHRERAGQGCVTTQKVVRVHDPDAHCEFWVGSGRKGKGWLMGYGGDCW